MTRPDRRMALTLFILEFGYHTDAWRLPGSRAEEVGHLSLTRDMVQAAERAKIDAVFFADSHDVNSVRNGGNRATGLNEPVSSMGAMIPLTEKIGIMGTISTTFSEPYNVARQLAGLDTLSSGRIGWNIVTSIMGNHNFGMEKMPPPDERYRRAAEFVDVVKKLWESWDGDAVIADRESGWWVDAAKIRDIDHVGEFFDVQGALNMASPPQMHPALVQAGQSETGVSFGSSVADVVYTAQPEQARAIAFRDDFHRRAAALGRDPRMIKILPGIMPIIGDTEAEARDLSQQLADLINPVQGRYQVERVLDVDTSDLDLDEMIPPERLVDHPDRHERWRSLHRPMADRMTIRELMVEFSRAAGHQWVVGTAPKIADLMIDWFESGACDGFNLNPPDVPVGMHRMLDLLVPELQERGYAQHEYRGDSLRERMGLEVLRAPKTATVL
ncbi:MAG: NtaA/DmoA family FMN-dependent monooxygenase [Pseudoclavibacter sp.]